MNDPQGMTIWHADPLGALFVTPLVWLFGVSIAYTVLIWAHIAFAGWVAHGFAADWLAWRRACQCAASFFMVQGAPGKRIA